MRSLKPSSPWGPLESFYYAFGDTDVLGVFDVPEQADALRCR